MARQKAHKVLELPQSTGECDHGPIMEYERGERGPRLKVRYDTYVFKEAEGVENNLIWTTINFSAVIGMRFTPEVATTLIMLEGSSAIAEVENSNWLSEMRKQAAKSKMVIPERFKHFMIYFHDHGCLEVIAMSVRLVDDEDSKPVPDR